MASTLSKYTDWYIGKTDTGFPSSPRDAIDADREFELTGGSITFNEAAGTITFVVAGDYFDPNMLAFDSPLDPDTAPDPIYGLLTQPGDLFIAAGYDPALAAAHQLQTGATGPFSTLTKNDDYTPGSWDYVVKLQGVPFGVSYPENTPLSGSIGIYQVVEDNVVLSQEWRAAVPATNPPGGLPSRTHYRFNQEIVYDPVGQTSLAATGSWAVDTIGKKLTITMPWIAEFKTSAFATQGWSFHWTQTCANDVIETYVAPDRVKFLIVPEPGSVVAGLLGLAGLAALRRRR